MAVSTVPKPVMMTVRTMLSLGDLLEQLEAAHAGHLEIGDHQVVAAARSSLQRLVAVLDGVDDVALHGEEVGEDLADHLLVVDDQDARDVGVEDVLDRLRRVRLRSLGQEGLSVARAHQIPVSISMFRVEAPG